MKYTDIKRKRIDMTWEQIRDVLGLENIFHVEQKEWGLSFFSYYNNTDDHVEGSLSVPKRFEPKHKLVCDIDGDILFVTKYDFENLMESPHVILDLTDEQLQKLKDMKKSIW